MNCIGSIHRCRILKLETYQLLIALEVAKDKKVVKVTRPHLKQTDAVRQRSVQNRPTIVMQSSPMLLRGKTLPGWLPILPTVTLSSCLWSGGIFPSLPGSRPMNFYRDASSALLELVNQWLSFIYSCSRAFRHGKKNTNYGFPENRTHGFRTSRCTWLPTRPLGRRQEYYLSRSGRARRDVGTRRSAIRTTFKWHINETLASIVRSMYVIHRATQ